eukprot:scaffold175061_cov16-Prasinocladus_malaysianus.AAC.1
MLKNNDESASGRLVSVPGPVGRTVKPELSLHCVHSDGELWHSMMQGSMKFTKPAYHQVSPYKKINRQIFHAPPCIHHRYSLAKIALIYH